LLSKNGDSAFQKRFFRIGIETIWQFRESADIKPQDKGAAAYCSVFLVSGSLSLVQDWLQNGMDTPAPELAKMLARLIYGCVAVRVGVWPCGPTPHFGPPRFHTVR
jgi:hypothetical protein